MQAGITWSRLSIVTQPVNHVVLSQYSHAGGKSRGLVSVVTQGEITCFRLISTMTEKRW